LQVKVADSAANISGDTLRTLHDHLGQISAIQITDNAPIAIDVNSTWAGNYNSSPSYLGSIFAKTTTANGAPVSLALSGVAASDVKTLMSLVHSTAMAGGYSNLANTFGLTADNWQSKLASVSITDSATALLSGSDNLDALAALGGKLGTITISANSATAGTPGMPGMGGANSTLMLNSLAQYQADSAVIAKLNAAVAAYNQTVDAGHQIGFTVGISNLSVADALATAQSLAHAQIGITDTAQNITAHLAELQSLASNGTLSTINLSGTGMYMASGNSAALWVSYDQFINSQDVLHKITGSYGSGIGVQGLTAAQAVAFNDAMNHGGQLLINGQNINLNGFGGNGIALKVFDTGAAITANLPALRALSASGRLASIVQNDKPAQAAVAVDDSASAISANVDAFAALGDRVISAHVNDSGSNHTINVSAGQLARDANFLQKLTGNYTLNIMDGVTADLAPQLLALNHVGSVQITDSSANIAAHLSDLQQLGASLTRIVVNNPVVGNNAWTSNNNVLTLTSGQYQQYNSFLQSKMSGGALAVAGLSAQDALALLDSSHSSDPVRVSAVVIADSGDNLKAAFATPSFAQIAASPSFAQIDNQIAAIYKTETDAAGHITHTLGHIKVDALAALVNPDLSFNNSSGGSNTITASATVALLAQLPDGGITANNWTSKVDQVVVQDTADHLQQWSSMSASHPGAQSVNSLSILEDLATHGRLQTIKLVDNSGALSTNANFNLSPSDLIAYQDVFSKLDTSHGLSYSIALNGGSMSVAQALSFQIPAGLLAHVSGGASVSISDTPANVVSHLGDLVAMDAQGKLGSIYMNDPSMAGGANTSGTNLNYAQLQQLMTSGITAGQINNVLNKLGGGASSNINLTVDLSTLTANDASNLQTIGQSWHINSINVIGSHEQINTSGLSALGGNGKWGLVFDPATGVVDNYQSQGLNGNTLSNNLDTLASWNAQYGDRLHSVHLSDSNVNVSGAQYLADQAVLAKVVTQNGISAGADWSGWSSHNWTLNVGGGNWSAAQAAALANSTEFTGTRVSGSVMVSDSLANIGQYAGALAKLNDAGKLSSISVMGSMAGNSTLWVSAQDVGSLGTLANRLSNQVGVQDTAANVAATLATHSSLKALVVDTADHLASVDLSAFTTQIAGVYSVDSHTLSQINAATVVDLANPSMTTGGYVSPASLAANLHALGVQSLSDLASVQITDSVNAIFGNLDALQAVNQQIAGITVTANPNATTGVGAGTNSVWVNAASLLADSAILAKMGAIPAGSITVTNASVADALSLSHGSLANAIGTIQINDSYSHLNAHLDDLAALGSQLGSINASSGDSWALTSDTNSACKRLGCTQ
jgi:hypothetical protein